MKKSELFAPWWLENRVCDSKAMLTPLSCLRAVLDL